MHGGCKMSKKRTLLRSQKKAVFEMVRAAGLEPADFDWSRPQAEGVTVSRLDYVREDYYFQFSSCEAGAYCIASPGRYQLVEYHYPKNWEEQTGYFRNWTQHLRREIQCHDPWSDLAKYRVPIEAACHFDGQNEAISGVEAQEVAQQLTELAYAIAMEYDLPKEQAAFVQARLAYLSEAAMREKSLDWAHSALGVCITLAMALSLDREQTARLWALLKCHVGAFIHFADQEAPHRVRSPWGSPGTTTQ